MKIFKHKDVNHYSLLVVYIFFSVSVFLNCSSKKESDKESELKQVYEIENMLTIGNESQGENYQLGDPIGVRTDKEMNIYVADRAALTIKVFNKKGEFIKELGRRGRGPAEFLDINTFEVSPDETFFILDRGNLRYTHIDKNGNETSSQKADFSMQWQFYPDDIDYYEDKVIALYNSGGFDEEKELIDKKLFYVYDNEFINKDTAFFKFSEFENLEFNTFSWISFLGKPGSFTLNETKDEMYYSPYIYHQNIYHFKRNDHEWTLQNIIRTYDFGGKSFVKMDTPLFQKYRDQKVPGLWSVMFGGAPEPHSGRVNIFDAGIHRLNDGRLISFIGKWRDNLDKEGVHKNLIDIHAQILNPEDNSFQLLGLITTIEASETPWKPFINWMDTEGNFYLLDNTDLNYPTVKKFQIKNL